MSKCNFCFNLVENMCENKPCVEFIYRVVTDFYGKGLPDIYKLKYVVTRKFNCEGCGKIVEGNFSHRRKYCHNCSF